MLHTVASRPTRTLSLVTFFALCVTFVGAGAVCAESQAFDKPAHAELIEKASTKKLPREWQWKKKAIRFDGMYRSF